jgi:hypothetical protein
MQKRKKLPNFREFELKPYDILEAVSFEAIRIDNEISTEVESEWMIFNRKFLGDSNQFNINNFDWYIYVIIWYNY